MHNEPLTQEMDALRLELHILTQRVNAAEAQLEELDHELKWKQHLWTDIRKDLAKMGWIVAGMVIAIFWLIRPHV